MSSQKHLAPQEQAAHPDIRKLALEIFNPLKSNFEMQLIQFFRQKPIRDRFLKGCKVIYNNLPKRKPLEDWETAIDQIKNFLKQFKDIPPNNSTNNEFITSLKDSPSLQKLLEVSDSTLGRVFVCGQQLYDHRLFKDAADVFFIVAFFNIKRSAPWIALGLSEQKLNRFSEALNAFALGAVTDSLSAEPIIYSAECYLEQGEEEDAAKSLTLAEEVIHKNPKINSELEGKVKQLRSKLKKNHL